jgi:hypothetical protein
MMIHYAAGLILLCMSTVGAYKSGTYISAWIEVLGSDLDQYWGAYVEALFGELAHYALSKRIKYDLLQDLSAANLMIYGTSAFEMQGDGSTTSLTLCDVIFGDVSCSSCDACAIPTLTTETSWTIGTNQTTFGCKGVVDDHSCDGVSFPDPNLESGYCGIVEENAFDGAGT